MASIVGSNDNEDLYGTRSADRISARAGDDALYGFGGNDILRGESDYDLLVGGLGNDTLNGGSEIDTASYADATGAIGVDLRTGRSSGNRGADTLISIENLQGGGYDDHLSGDGGANRLDGGAGDDTVLGGSGDDVLIAGLGSDTLVGGTGVDTVIYELATSGPGSGVWVSLRLGVAHHPSGGNTAWTDALSQIENVEGTMSGDYIEGNGGANFIEGAIGSDHLRGGAGDDVISGGIDNDLIEGGRGNDFVEGGTDDDTLAGDRGSDVLEGGTGNDLLFASGRCGLGESSRSHDVLNGGVGDDTLVAGRGFDEMSGGQGADTFRFRAVADASGSDRITDFRQGQDRIDLSQIDANGATPGDDAFVFRAAGSPFTHPGEVSYAIRGEMTYVMLNTDFDARAEGVIAFESHIDFTGGDFLL